MSSFQFDRRRAQDWTLYEHQQELVHELLAATSPLVPGSMLRIEVATGGGKNVIINDFIARRIFASDLRVLVVTKDWPLLAQQASDLCKRHQSALRRVGYVGGKGAREFAGLTRSPSAQIVYTTIQTWVSRKNTDFAAEQFQVVVIDEVHWGDDAVLYEELLTRYKEQAVFIGLSATPRRGTTFRRVGQAYGFGELVARGILAAPDVVSVPTGVRWAPHRVHGRGDITPMSLAELGSSSSRNELIVATYGARRVEFGKTLVFACNIEHAEELARRALAAGARAAALHSHLPSKSQERALDDFRSSRLDVLVSVGMMTTGVDVPDIKTLLLARPTMSEILAAQMIGRGSRKSEGKTSFFVVDFVDLIDTHGIDFVRPGGFLGIRAGSPSRGPRIERHQFEPVPLEVLQGDLGYEALDGLEVQPAQSFGIEFEFHAPDDRYAAIAGAMIEALRSKNIPVADRPCTEHSGGQSLDHKDHTVWNVEPDSTCGVEVTSRILRGAEGFREVVDACGVLSPLIERLGIRTQHSSAGTHVHLGWNLEPSELRRLMVIAAYYEPAIFSLVAPSRADNTFALPVRPCIKELLSFAGQSEWSAAFADHARRHLAVNPCNLFGGYGTVEIRYHSGTSNAAKILQWISLWMRILASASDRDAEPGEPRARVRSRPLCRGRRGDIRELCNWLGVGPRLAQRLALRRAEVVGGRWRADSRYSVLADRMMGYWSRREDERRKRIVRAVMAA